ncbi:MAG: nucleobase:cation symporter-2 family protein [Actinomycetota bacterium]
MSTASDDIVYRLEDRPSLGHALLAAIQHLLAVFIAIVTPTLVLAAPLELDRETTNYLVSMALIVSGVSTFIQIRRVGPVGSGLLNVQGTSFSFIDPMISAGTSAGLGTAGLAMIYGLTLAGSTIEMVLSRFLHRLRRVLTPVVTGTVVTLIGLSLIQVGFTDMAGGSQAEDFGSLQNLGLAGLTLVVIIVLNRVGNTVVRMGAIAIGLAVGYAVAAIIGRVSFGDFSDVPAVTVPIPFRFGLDFDFGLFIPIAVIYVVTTIESVGDITATSEVSGEPVEGETYVRRIKGGVLGDGVNSAIAAVFNTFPNVTFGQNNGVIQITGVASRFVGYFVALFLVLFGLIPIVGEVVTSIPRPVLGGATIVMFGTVAATGIKIIASAGEIGRRELLILAVSLGLGLGVQLVPEALQEFPDTVQTVLGSAITVGGLTALLLNVILPADPEPIARDAGRSQ